MQRGGPPWRELWGAKLPAWNSLASSTTRISVEALMVGVLNVQICLFGTLRWGSSLKPTGRSLSDLCSHSGKLSDWILVTPWATNPARTTQKTTPRSLWRSGRAMYTCTATDDNQVEDLFKCLDKEKPISSNDFQEFPKKKSKNFQEFQRISKHSQEFPRISKNF